MNKQIEIDTLFEKICKNSSRDINDYNKVLNLCERYDRKTTEIFGKMEKMGIQPTSKTYSLLLRNYAFADRVSKFDELWEQIILFDDNLLYMQYVKIYYKNIKNNSIYRERILYIYDRFMAKTYIFNNLGLELIIALQGDIIKKNNILTKMIASPNHCSNSIIYYKLFRLCDDKKYAIFESIRASGLNPSDDLYAKILRVFPGDKYIFIEVFKMVEKYRPPMTNRLLYLLITRLCDNNEYMIRIGKIVAHSTKIYEMTTYEILISTLFRQKIQCAEIIWQVYSHMKEAHMNISMRMYNYIIQCNIGPERVIEIYHDIVDIKLISDSIYINIISILTHFREYFADLWQIYSSMNKKITIISCWKAICKYFCDDINKMLIIYNDAKVDPKIFKAIHAYLIVAFHNDSKIEEIYERVVNKHIKLSLTSIQILLRYFNVRHDSRNQMKYLFTLADTLSHDNNIHKEFPIYFEIMMQTNDITIIKYLCHQMQLCSIIMNNNHLCAILEAFKYNDKIEEAIPLLDNKYFDGKIIIFNDENVFSIETILYMRYIRNNMPSKIKTRADKIVICDYLKSLGFDTQIILNDIFILPDSISIDGL